MNRYPVWKYAILAIAVVFGLLYTLPNFFGEAPAIQVSSGKATVRLEPAMAGRVETALREAGIEHTGIFADANSIKARFRDTDTQLRAKDVVSRALNPDPADPTWIVALNLLSNSPNWLTSIGALPMYLGLDLRGGVHFLLQVDMKEALDKRVEATVGDLRTLMRDKNIRHAGIARVGDGVEVRFRDADTRNRARNLIADSLADLATVDAGEGEDLRLVARFKP